MLNPVNNLQFLYHTRYKYDMSVEEASELARRAIYHATFRDGASGGVASGILPFSPIDQLSSIHTHI